MRSLRRTSLLSIALLLAIALGSLPRAAHAEPAAGFGYSGVTSDGGRITFDVSEDGSRINSLILSYPTTSVNTGCPANAALNNIAISTAHAVSVNAAVGNSGQSISVAGVFAADGGITGTISAAPGTGSSCANRGNLQFAAIQRAPSPNNPPAGMTFRGATSLGGQLTFTMASDRRSIASGNLALVVGGCDYGAPLSDIPNDAVTVGTFDLTVRGGTNTFDAVGTFMDGDTAGAFVVATAGCPNALATFALEGSGGVTPGFTPRPVFSASGFAFAVFAGGSVEDLEAAARAVNARGVWVQESGGGYQLLVIGGPAFLKADFNAKFRSGLSVTSVTLTR